MKFWKIKVHLVAQEFFQYSLITYLVLLSAETLKSGFVNFFFDLHFLLVFVLVSGIIMVITYDEKMHVTMEVKKEKMTVGYIFYILILSLGGAFLVFAGTYELGMIAFFVAGITAVIILLLSLLIVTDK